MSAALFAIRSEAALTLVFDRETAGNGISIQKLSLCKHISAQPAVENPFLNNFQIVENYPVRLLHDGIGMWITLWKMFITCCT